MNTYTHTPRSLVEAELTKVNLVKSASATVFSENGDLIKEHQPKRRHEFDGTLYRYYSDVAKYLCTHYKVSLKDMITRYGIRIKWETFVKMAIGEHHDQYHRFINEIGRNATEPKYCYLPKQDSGYFFMLPFILDFETADNDSLSDKEKKQLLQLSEKDGVQRRKIGYVTFSFAKPLFQKYREGGQYYQHPTAFYAEAYQLFSEFHEKDTKTGLKEIEAHVDIFMSFTDYLYLHGAGTHDKITVDLFDMAKRIMPGAIQEKNGKPYIRDMSGLTELLSTFTTISKQLKGLDYKVESIELIGSGNLLFYFSHPKRRAKYKRRPTASNV
jgi:hypothetical protein